MGSRHLPHPSETVRWLVAAAVVAVACTLLGRARDAALDHAARLEGELTQLGDLAAAYEQLAVAQAVSAPASAGSQPEIPVRTLVERATREAVRRGTVVSLEPMRRESPSQPAPALEASGLGSGEGVELRVSGTPLVDLVDLLYALERGRQPLRVDRLHVRRTVAERADMQGAAALDVTAVLDPLRPGR
jgi:hypothetical protein